MVLVGAGLTVLIAAALAVGWFLMSRPAASAPPEASSPTATPTGTGMASPTASEVTGLQNAMSSGSENELRPIVGATPGQALSPDFAAKVKQLGIRFDASSLRPLGSGIAWEATATDNSGGQWQVGLIRDKDGHIQLVYAEKAQ